MSSNAELCSPLVSVEAEQDQRTPKVKTALALLSGVALVSGACVLAMDNSSPEPLLPTNLDAGTTTAGPVPVAGMPKWIQYGVGAMVGVVVLALLYAKICGTKKNLQQADEQKQESRQRWAENKDRAVFSKVYEVPPTSDKDLGDLFGLFEQVNQKGHSIVAIDSVGNIKTQSDDIAVIVQGSDMEIFPLQLVVRAKEDRTVTFRGGKSGIQTDADGNVTNVTEPAKSAGVQGGWKIVAINGQPFTPTLLSGCGSRVWPYDVKFA